MEPTHGRDDDYYTKNERFTKLSFLEQMVELIKQEAITEATKRERYVFRPARRIHFVFIAYICSKLRSPKTQMVIADENSGPEIKALV